MPVGKRHPKQLWSMSRSGEEGYSATGGAKASSRTADLLPHEPNQKETARPINRSSPACGDYLRRRFYYESCAGFSDTCTQTDVISDGRVCRHCLLLQTDTISLKVFRITRRPSGQPASQPTSQPASQPPSQPASDPANQAVTQNVDKT